MKPKTNRPAVSGASYDKCQTNPLALAPLYQFLDQFKHGVLWESAAGERLLSDKLCERYRVLVSDIEYSINCDFFQFERTILNEHNIVAQVTNPPYSLKYKWLEHSYHLDLPFALLLPIKTLGAAKAQKLFARHGMQMIVFSKRNNFKMPEKGWDSKGAQFPTAWFTWQFNLPRDIMYWDVLQAKYNDNK